MKPVSHRKKVTITRKLSHPTRSQEFMKNSMKNFMKYYPSLLDPNFNSKIAKHAIFKRYKLHRNTKKIEALYKAFVDNTMPLTAGKKPISIRILKPTQKLLRNYMSPFSPYRSLIIYHEMGVGKTCTAITIAESLKNLVKNSNTKIYVIRPDEIERQIFDINVVRENKPLNQCTGDTYLQKPQFTDLINNCISGNDMSCNQLETMVKNDINSFYEFSGAQLWAN